MKELNDVEKKEIEIKQHRLKTLLSINKLVDSADADTVDKDDITNYANNEKNSLVLDIINSLHITDFDELYSEVDGSNVICSIEDTIKHFSNSENLVERSIYDEFVSVLASYDISDLLGYEFIHQYLKIIDVITSCYDEIDLGSCKTI